MPTERSKVGFISGFCGMGQHEGTRPRSYLGNPMKTCERILTTKWKSWSCACKCHADLDMLFEMSNMPRVIQVNPEYQPVRVVVVMPTLEERAARFKRVDATPPRVVKPPPPVLYGTMHNKIIAARGSASAQPCVDCGLEARDWCYDHKDTNELEHVDTRQRGGRTLEPRTRKYSEDVNHYEPRCRPCHMKFDKEHGEELPPEVIPATIERSFTPTASGRAGRGELELLVKKECDQWVLDNPEESCTPSYISERIAHDLGIKPPSVGAISAVFDRWTALGFALIGKKPTRFVGYMPDGVKYGLEGLKDRARKAKHQSLR